MFTSSRIGTGHLWEVVLEILPTATGRLCRVKVPRGSSRKLGLGWRGVSSGGLERPESTLGELDGQMEWT